jgi:two-component system response regulator AlgR
MIKVLIVDDEMSAGVRIEHMLSKVKNIKPLATVSDIAQAIELSATQEPDIVVVKLPASGSQRVVDFVDKLEILPIIIFCPSFEGYDPIPSPIKRMNSSCMKLVNSEDLLSAILNASRAIHQRCRAGITEARKHLYIYSYKGIETIPVDDILLFQAAQKYVVVHTAYGTATINDSLAALIVEFSGLFVRIHRNALVAIKAIDKLQQDDDKLVVVIKGLDIKPVVSRRRASNLRQLIPLL